MSAWATLMPYVFDWRNYVRSGCARNNYCDSGDCVARASRVKRVSVATSSQSSNQEKEKEKNRRCSSQETTRREEDDGKNPQESVIWM